MHLFCLLCIFLLGVSVNGTSTANNCSLTSLTEALYTDENFINLTKVFYPTNIPSAKYVKVNYKISDELWDDCNVTYIWTKTRFLTILPPDVFQYTSLLFYHQYIGSLPELYLTLPASCRDLVYSNCSCYDAESDLLVFLTNQVANLLLSIADGC